MAGAIPAAGLRPATAPAPPFDAENLAEFGRGRHRRPGRGPRTPGMRDGSHMTRDHLPGLAGRIRSSAERPDRGGTRLDRSRVDDRPDRRVRTGSRPEKLQAPCREHRQTSPTDPRPPCFGRPAMRSVPTNNQSPQPPSVRPDLTNVHGQNARLANKITPRDHRVVDQGWTKSGWNPRRRVLRRRITEERAA